MKYLKIDHTAATSSYRPDIDGLRAVAVVAVVIFHAFPTLIYSGFIGVDIFFVISGYLISSIIYKQLDDNAFSIAGFYGKRIRRLFPALVFVLAVVLLFGWFVLLGTEYQQLGKHVAAGAGFVSNLVLWSESGYFDADAATKPLLHLWSLGIEEQFYIFFPLIAWLTWRFGLNRFYVIPTVLAASLAWCLYLTSTDSVQSFYSPLSRAWELMFGAWLSLLLHRPITTAEQMDKVFSQKIISPNHLSLVGVCLLILGFIFIEKGEGFPGYWALFPVLGTVFIIAAGPTALLNKNVLGSKLFVSIGLISYPLYLWHWVVLVLPAVVKGQELSNEARGILVVLAFVLAFVTYRYIEKPLRYGRRKKLVTAILAVMMASLGGFGFYIFKHDGIAHREESIMQEVYQGDTGHEEFHRYYDESFYPCLPVSIHDKALTWKKHRRCHQSKEQGIPEMLLIGDSHAEHLFIGLAENIKEKNIGYYIGKSIPVIGSERVKHIFDYVLQEDSIKEVVLTAFWSYRARELTDGKTLKSEIDNTVRILTDAGKIVYLIEDNHIFSFDPKRCKYQRIFRDKNVCEDSIRGYEKRNAGYLSAIQSLSDELEAVTAIRIQNYLCEENKCSMVNNDNHLLYRDKSHFNIPGSKYIGSRILADHPELKISR